MKALYVRFFCAVLLVVTATMAAAARAAGPASVHADTVIAQGGPSPGLPYAPGLDIPVG